MWKLIADSATNFSRTEYEILSVADLDQRIDQLIARREGMLFLRRNREGEQAEYLGLAVEGSIGHVHYQSSDFKCVAAIAPTPASGPPVEFNIGGTATEIDRQYCIPLDLMRQIAVTYFESKTLSSCALWQDFY